MKLHNDFVLYDMGNEYTLVPVGQAAEGFHGILQANKSAGVILNCLKEETSLEAIVDALEARFEASREELTAATQELLDELRREGALQE